MWQLFDKGLHLFLKTFIYLPIVNSFLSYPTGSRILASILCYFTVYYWHGKIHSMCPFFVYFFLLFLENKSLGATETCMWWALFNWLGIIAEQQLYRMTKTDTFLRPQHRYLKDRSLILVKAILFGMLINSNLIYLFQSDTSFQIILRLYTENVLFLFTAHAVLYCGIIAISTNNNEFQIVQVHKED